MNIIQQYQRMATEYIFHVLLAALGIATLILNVVVFLVGLRLPFAKPKSAPISSLPSRPKRKRRTLPVQDKALLQEQLDPLDPCEADPLAIDEHESQATPTPTKKRWSSPAKFFSPDFFPFSPRPSICSDATSTTLCSPSPPRYHPELSRVSSAGSLAEASFSKCPSTPSRPSSPSRPSFFTAHRPTMSVRLPSISLLTTKLRRSSTVADPGEVDRPRAASDPCVWAEKRSPPSEPPALARRASTKPTSPRSKCQTSSRPSASHARCSSRSPPSVVPPRTSSNAPQALPRQVPSSASQASPRRMSSHASQALPHRTPSSSPHVRPRQMSTPASPRRQRTGAGAEGSRGAPQSEEVHTTFVNPFRIKPRRAKTLSLRQSRSFSAFRVAALISVFVQRSQSISLWIHATASQRHQRVRSPRRAKRVLIQITPRPARSQSHIRPAGGPSAPILTSTYPSLPRFALQASSAVELSLQLLPLCPQPLPEYPVRSHTATRTMRACRPT
ncbi:hypothetical protein AcV7_001041 [Taiwanofungus camphoratus]|nr:hypothetical protein AcV7_001041 [Antrodia cinnamomea]